MKYGTVMAQGPGGQLIVVKFVTANSAAPIWTPQGLVDIWASAPMSLYPKPKPIKKSWTPLSFDNFFPAYQDADWDGHVDLDLIDSINPFTKALDAFETGKAGWIKGNYYKRMKRRNDVTE